jgi:hypothetical protein
MEACKYENEIKRLLKIMDGNGDKGIVFKLTVMAEKQIEMAEYIACLVEEKNQILTSINGFTKYMASEEVIKSEQDKYRIAREADIKERQREANERKKERRAAIFFVIAQTIVLISLAISLMK